MNPKCGRGVCSNSVCWCFGKLQLYLAVTEQNEMTTSTTASYFLIGGGVILAGVGFVFKFSQTLKFDASTQREITTLL